MALSQGLALARVLLLAGAALAACAPVPPPGPPPPTRPQRPPPEPHDACGAGRLQRFVGRPFRALRPHVDTSRTRVLRPGDAMTMDYSPFRLNVLLDRNGRVDRIWCG